MDFGFDNIKSSVEELGRQIQSIEKDATRNNADTTQESFPISQSTNVWLILAIALIAATASAGIGISASIWTNRKRQP